jgi:hypothetical protein
MIAGLILASLAGSGSSLGHGALFLQPNVAPTTMPPPKEVDVEVFHAVFADLLSLNDKESPVAIQARAPSTLSFSIELPRWKTTTEQILQPYRKQHWDALNDQQLQAAREAAEAVLQRRSSRYHYHSILLIDPRVIVWETRPRPTKPSAFQRPIHAQPPGYSQDQRYAIVHLTIPWSIHHADGTYLLERSPNGWKVVLRQFIYYV